MDIMEAIATPTTAVITAIQNEIEAAQHKRAAIKPDANGYLNKYIELGGYIKGLNTALALITKPSILQELGY